MYRLTTFTVSDVANLPTGEYITVEYKGLNFLFSNSPLSASDAAMWVKYAVTFPDGKTVSDNSLSYLKQLCREFVQCFDTDAATRAAVAAHQNSTPAPTLVPGGTVYTLELELANGEQAHKEYNDYRKAKAEYDLTVQRVQADPTIAAVSRVVRIELFFSEAVGSMDKWEYECPKIVANVAPVMHRAEDSWPVEKLNAVPVADVAALAQPKRKFLALVQIKPGHTRQVTFDATDWGDANRQGNAYCVAQGADVEITKFNEVL